eukprot:TRINITY_DN457_c0_g2_i2.p1 TRINITY_DN457_c0_g2~~TRINITY_DN457_c0_g2_i2.p1  ORF type:complete len:423 (-),score=89.20 TRINITY_DN457_c0_g2_i2:882-2150(-)
MISPFGSFFRPKNIFLFRGFHSFFKEFPCRLLERRSYFLLHKSSVCSNMDIEDIEGTGSTSSKVSSPGELHEAIFYDKIGSKGAVRCRTCKRMCTIRPGETGECAVRYNEDGRLTCLVYGHATGGPAFDPIEKKPLAHFLPGTFTVSFGTIGCNFSCRFCQNHTLSQYSKDLKADVRKEKLVEAITSVGMELTPQDAVDIALRKHLPTMVYTYNEPTIFFEYLFDTSKIAKKHGLKNVMVTNGYESDDVMDALAPYIDAMNIDLKAFTEKFYQEQCNAKLSNVLGTIRKAKELGIWIELTTLLIPDANDSDEEITDIAEFIYDLDPDIPWHISAFTPKYKMKDRGRTPESTLFRAYDIGKKVGLRYVYLGNIHSSKIEHQSTLCPQCGELLIKREWHRTQVMGAFSKGTCKKCGFKIAGVFE